MKTKSFPRKRILFKKNPLHLLHQGTNYCYNKSSQMTITEAENHRVACSPLPTIIASQTTHLLPSAAEKNSALN